MASNMFKDINKAISGLQKSVDLLDKAAEEHSYQAKVSLEMAADAAERGEDHAAAGERATEIASRIRALIA